MRHEHDEFAWAKYPDEYRNQLYQMAANAGDNGSDFMVTFRTKVGPGGIEYGDKLHSNWRDMYDTVFGLKPSSAYEAGCGGMYHMYNLRKLFPHMLVRGSDLLPGQLENGKRVLGIPAEDVEIRDFTQPVDDVPKHDLCYCHAVMMHLSDDNAEKFMRNMMEVARRWVMFTERVSKRDWSGLVAKVGGFGWNVSMPGKRGTDLFLLERVP